MIKNQIFLLDKDKAGGPAKRFFMDMCGYGNGKPVAPKKIERAMTCLDDIYDQLEIKALVSEYPGSCINGTRLELDGETFTCKALSQISPGEIERIYVYLLTAGEPVYHAGSALNEVYCDLWQNAYIETGLDLLRQYLQGQKCNEQKYVSSSIGPGFYGMDAEALKQIFSIMDSSAIKMELLEGGFMSPVKSFAGFFIVTGCAWEFAGEDCINCPSEGTSCRYCRIGYSRGK